MNQESIKKQQLISVIMVTFNAVTYIEDTIKSVIHQTYSNIEYIIVDGGSTDGTINLINKYKSRIKNLVFTSEPDNGIFDAMNKGIKLAKGKWINFMNAGDSFVSNNAISSVFLQNISNSDILFGDTIMSYNNIHKPFKTLLKAKSVNVVWRGHMPFCHQSMFSKLSLHKIHPFDISSIINADFEFICWALFNNYTFLYLQMKIAVYEVGGKSSDDYVFAFQDRMLAIKKYKKGIFPHIIFLFQHVNYYIKKNIKRVLPNSIVKIIIIIKTKLRKHI